MKMMVMLDDHDGGESGISGFQNHCCFIVSMHVSEGLESSTNMSYQNNIEIPCLIYISGF